MRIQTWGRVIGLTYMPYRRSLPWKIKGPTDDRGASVEHVECNPLDDHITRRSSPLPSLDHMESHSTLLKTWSHSAL